MAAAVLAPRPERGALLSSAVVVAFSAPLSLYLAYDISAVGRWPMWTIVLVGWAGWELFWSTRSAPLVPQPG